MMYFATVQTRRPANKKQAELIGYAEQFDCLLIKDELGLDALKRDVRLKVEDLNAKYPRTKVLVCATWSTGDMACYPECECDSVFSITTKKVRGFYEFSEDNRQEIGQEGGAL